MIGERSVHDLLADLGVPFEELTHRGDGAHFGFDEDGDPALDDHHDVPDGDRIPAVHPKCLFLEDEQAHHHFLVILPKPKRLELGGLARELGVRRLKFGSRKTLAAWLRATPGTLSGFSPIHDRDRRIVVIIDDEILSSERLGFHAEDDTATLIVSPSGLLRFLEETGHPPRRLAL